jgi:ubiquitin-conjugating enzyme E2 D/E
MSKGLTKLQQEYKYIRKSGCLAHIGGAAGPINKDYFHWSACFIGPKGSPYEGGLFFIEMKFDSNYPESHPIDVQMRTPTYHPNISSSNGHICVSYTWPETWKKTNNIVGIINAVWDLLAEEHPTNGYQGENRAKASEFKSRYAYESQEYDWNSSWGKGWSLN